MKEKNQSYRRIIFHFCAIDLRPAVLHRKGEKSHDLLQIRLNISIIIYE